MCFVISCSVDTNYEKKTNAIVSNTWSGWVARDHERLKAVARETQFIQKP